MKLVKCVKPGKTRLVKGMIYEVRTEDENKYYIQGEKAGHKKSRFVEYYGENDMDSNYKEWSKNLGKYENLFETKYNETKIIFRSSMSLSRFDKIVLFFYNLFNGKKENK